MESFQTTERLFENTGFSALCTETLFENKRRNRNLQFEAVYITINGKLF
jgi:hypothetical protein